MAGDLGRRPSEPPAAGALGARRPRRATVLLSCGRPHLYEGWTDTELERPVDDLADAGVRGLLLTNAVGALEPALATGQAVVVTEVVDLQREPRDRVAALPVTGVAAADRLAAALGPRSDGTGGTLRRRPRSPV